LNPEARKPFIAGNWKMNKTVAEARKLALEIRNGTLNESDDVEILICPPFGSLYPVSEVLKGSAVKLGAQNCYWEENGAFTGEMSPSMIKDLGCDYTIVGHSERRSYFHETDEWVSKKARALLDVRVSPIVCVGEVLQDREAGRTNDVIRGQMLGSLDGLSSEDMLRAVLAYEPVWAIGTGKTASPEQAQEVHAFMRNILIDLYGLEVALRVRIQYGGSVKPENVTALMGQPDIDGALVGGASLEAASFLKLVSFKTGGID
jgi:triosephosphate isomerase